jgi:hypothetical protein
MLIGPCCAATARKPRDKHLLGWWQTQPLPVVNPAFLSLIAMDGTHLSRAGAKREIRIEIDADDVSLAVLDGYCQGTGQDRTRVMLSLLKEWAEKKLHEAKVVCRVSGHNPFAPDSGRTQDE